MDEKVCTITTTAINEKICQNVGNARSAYLIALMKRGTLYSRVQIIAPLPEGIDIIYIFLGIQGNKLTADSDRHRWNRAALDNDAVQ